MMLSAFAATPAAAQGIFDLLFGGFRRASPPPPVHSYANPDGDLDRDGRVDRPAEYGPAQSYCVRTCDGRFFPIARNANASPAELCKAFCPAAQTKIYSGGGIAHAVASDGTRYADLPNAFAYRDAVKPGCTCNGRSELGLNRIEPERDPTLRPGDIVATEDGLMAYRSSRRGVAEFTPVSKSAVVGHSKLSSIKVQQR